MGRTIFIDPVTRIEGHARITIQLDENGAVSDARFHVTQFRGFEKFVEGRRFEEMPGITARICGICPVSHLLASAKAGDALMAVAIPPAADRLRRLLNHAQYVQSHALSFFHLSAPDLLLGMDAPVTERHVLGLAARRPELARDGIWLRQFGQQTIQRMAGRRIHPAWVVPGGVSAPLTQEARDRIAEGLPRAREIARRALDLHREIVGRFTAEIEVFANFPSLFLGTVDPDGTLEHTAGRMRVVDEARRVVADQIPAAAYAEFIGEAAVPFSYLKSPYYKPRGYPDGLYRVGPLARLNACERTGTPEADAALAEFRAPGAARGGAIWESFRYHQARLVEIVHALERIGELLDDPATLQPDVRAAAPANRAEGVGVAEAPRGTLIHHYRVNRHGQIVWVNLIVATGHNNMAMNRGVRDVARRFVRGDRIEEGALNRVEALIRCYDPCLSCSTHALGRMSLVIELIGPDGTIRHRRVRD